LTALWIVGAGGHGAVVADAAHAAGRWHAIAFFDDHWPAQTQSRGHDILGDVATLRERLAGASPENAEVVVAVGDNTRRLELSQALAAAGARLATVIHPFSALSPSATLGPGTVVLAGTVLNAGARVGMACIINTRASIDHDCTIGDGVHICPGVSLAGHVTVHDLAWLGIGSSAIQGVTIGHSATVGAGAAVVRDVRPLHTVAGCPAREIKRVES
jgi:sugar O-acyltransferase (sialic acid O-acetyltransferase NeuD family)